MTRILLMIATTLVVGFAQAAGIKPYSAETLREARAQGATVVLDFYADWCPVCRKQAKALPPVLANKDLAAVIVLKVDFDQEKALRQELKVSKQGTLVVFKGEQEVARAVGLTGESEIEALLRRGL